VGRSLALAVLFARRELAARRGDLSRAAGRRLAIRTHNAHTPQPDQLP